MISRLSRRTLHRFLLLSWLIASMVPASAWAQEEGPPAEPEPEAEAVVLSLREVLNAALEHNLNIAVRRYDPLRSDTQVTRRESEFDPTLTGDATSLQDERVSNQVIEDPFGTLTEFSFPSKTKNHFYNIRFQDPLLTGGNYRLELSGSDELTQGVFFDFTTFGTIPFGTKEFNASWNVAFTQPLLRNLGPEVNRWQILVAKNDLVVSEEVFRQTVINTLSEAESTYWNLNFALMELETQNSALQLAQEFLEQNKIKVRVGTLAPIEITQAEADVAECAARLALVGSPRSSLRSAAAHGGQPEHGAGGG
jgi:outer membrane protein TolC